MSGNDVQGVVSPFVTVKRFEVTRYEITGKNLYDLILQMLNEGAFDSLLQSFYKTLEENEEPAKPFSMDDITLEVVDDEYYLETCGNGYILLLEINKDTATYTVAGYATLNTLTRYVKQNGIIPLPEGRSLAIAMDDANEPYIERIIPRDFDGPILAVEIQHPID